MCTLQQNLLSHRFLPEAQRDSPQLLLLEERYRQRNLLGAARFQRFHLHRRLERIDQYLHLSQPMRLF